MVLATAASSNDADMDDVDMDNAMEEDVNGDDKEAKDDPDVNASSVEEQGSDDEEEEEEEDDDDDDDFFDAKTRRSSRVAKNAKVAAARGNARGRGAAAAAEGVRRTSSRSNKFTSSMAEPSGVRDLLVVATATGGEAKKKGAAATAAPSRRGGGGRGRKSASSSNDDDDSDGDDAAGDQGPGRTKRTTTSAAASGAARAGRSRAKQASMVRDSLASVSTTDGQSPKKSPARRHGKAARRSLHAKKKSSTEDSSDDGDDDSDAPVSSTEHVDEDDDDDEWSGIKIQRIIACRTETLATWRKICGTMNTSEIDNGSRWFQSSRSSGDSNENGKDDGGMVEKDDGKKKKDENEVFEERFLVKWSDLSYMHCSWETLADLCDQVENAKSYHSTFLKKSVNGLLFTADERADGQYFDPRFIQVERILDVSFEDDFPKTAKDEDSVGSTDFGIIIDKNDPRYEDGVGRQVLVKWGGNTPYSDCTYEYERDLVLQSIEYKEQIKSFWNRRSKPSKTAMAALLKTGDEERRRTFP
jgi:hypothetical protein